MITHSLVKVTANFNHDYVKKGDQYMALLNHEDKFLQFVLKNGYPTGYSLDSGNFDIEPLSDFFGKKTFDCDFGQNI